ncbi:MAG: hypothetical protein CEE43_07850 [Promethearchaeota archaeon Loki_b32]|nr:MAG: hypothetical protein CEE43_07850 [Candidatus Lokiarchaeota archaeon Loki_b32]
MSKKYFICRQNKKNCPFKILDMQLDFYICNYLDEFWREFNSGNSFGVKVLLNRACEWIQKEERRLRFISKSASKETISMLESIEIGDMLFWITQSKEVRLLEKPSEFTQNARINCQRSDGKVVEIPAYSLRKLSKGDFYGEYFLGDADNERRVKELEYKTMFYGFRVEVEKKDNGYLLKIYGDSQQEVDDFINLSLEQDFDISPYI